MNLRNKLESYTESSKAFKSMSEEEQKRILSPPPNKIEQILKVFEAEEQNKKNIETEYAEKAKKVEEEEQQQQAKKENDRKKKREQYIKKEAIERQNDEKTAQKLLQELNKIA